MPKNIDVSPAGLRADAMDFGLLAFSENLKAFDDAERIILAAADRIEQLEEMLNDPSPDD